MPEPAITSLISTEQPEAPNSPVTKISSIQPGQPIPLEVLRQESQQPEGDIRATIWQSLSSLPPEKASEIFELIKYVPQDLATELAANLKNTYWHSVLAEPFDSSKTSEGIPRLKEEDEKQMIRGEVAAYFANKYASSFH